MGGADPVREDSPGRRILLQRSKIIATPVARLAREVLEPRPSARPDQGDARETEASAVVGSTSATISSTLSAGNPPSRACRRIRSASGAR